MINESYLKEAASTSADNPAIINGFRLAQRIRDFSDPILSKLYVRPSNPATIHLTYCKSIS